MVELLGPAGTLEKLKWAAAFGADAVYFGLKHGSLRSYAGNFTLDEAAEGIRYLHSRGKKGYVTLNIYPFSDDYPEIIKSAGALSEIGADAVIISDLGVLAELKRKNINIPVHISTQSNTLSYQTVRAYHELDAKRVNLARELSFDQIKEIQENIKAVGVETEVFIHGSVCFSYSGRCAVSDYLTGRRANRGDCTQPCRWKYYLMEEERPVQFLPVFEDSGGLYLFNSRDLALHGYVKGLMRIGVNSLKIEGRMKSINYIASTVSLYRRIINGEIIPRKEIDRLLSRVSNRGYSTGFMKGDITPDDYDFEKSRARSNSVFAGNILEKGEKDHSVCRVRNKILAGEQLEALIPSGKTITVTMPTPLCLIDGEFIEEANNEQYLILNEKLPPFTILRRIIND